MPCNITNKPEHSGRRFTNCNKVGGAGARTACCMRRWAEHTSLASQPYFSLFPVGGGNKEKYGWLARLGAHVAGLKGERVCFWSGL